MGGKLYCMVCGPRGSSDREECLESLVRKGKLVTTVTVELMIRRNVSVHLLFSFKLKNCLKEHW